MGFWLKATLLILNGVIALILHFFTEFDCFAGQLCYFVWRWNYNVHKILSPSSSLPLLAITNLPCSAVSLRWLSYLLLLTGGTFFNTPKLRTIRFLLAVVWCQYSTVCLQKSAIVVSYSEVLFFVLRYSVSDFRTYGVAYSVRQKKVAPLKLFAIFSLVVHLCNWKLSLLLPKHISMSTPILVHLSEYLYELYHFY